MAPARAHGGPLRLLSAVATFALVAAASGCGKEPAAHGQTVAPLSAPAASTGAQVVAITVGKDGFVPNRIELARNRPATLRFTRNTDETCATEVAFKELGVKKELPLAKAVDVEIPTAEARTLTFACGMGMYVSTVVVQ